ncbi:MAG: Signal peptidase I [Parcubacteria group bacterium GW2011_GWA2_43_13]|nr:MAG: Signal peptidase I [Parcubacteria group bacterium GW2011_GWA2_43_13]HAZ16309.1 signal peptidase I [Candidatus Jacksonbacteria bacterium]
MTIPSLHTPSGDPRIKRPLTQKTARELVDGDTESHGPDRHDFGGFFIELVKMAAICVVLFVGIRYYIIKPFVVQGQSMHPTFETSEYLIIDELSYRFTEPARGDIVVFRYPGDVSQFFIKRVIGLPGEQIQCVNDAITIINKEHPDGFVLDESYLSKTVKTECIQPTILIPEGSYFVMGDNRSASLDSRRFGSLDRGYIVGKVLLRGWPFHRAGLITSPVYQ